MTQDPIFRPGLLALAIATLGAGSVQAQPVQPVQPAVSAPAQHDLPAGPQSLPGDNLPPFGMLDNRGRLKPNLSTPPGGFHHETGNPLETDAQGPSLALALEGAMAAVKACKAMGSFGAATVVDARGEVRAMLSSDGTDGSHVFVAQRKALTALEFGVPSDEAKAMVAKDPALLDRVRPNMFVQLGAFPLTSHGKVIGAIGYSGGEDIDCAKAGWQVIQAKLPA